MLTIAEIRAAMPVEAQAQLDAITAAVGSDKRAGGPWRLYLPNPHGRGLHLLWSYATKQEAETRLAGMYPAVRARAEIRHEVAHVG